MPHVDHIAKNKEFLELRFEITRLIREFFWQEGFLEVETPLILRLPGQEPYLNPMKVKIKNETGKKFQGYLHTSPEYTMKKMLAAGFIKIFSICKAFRDRESFGGAHNPEFTMIEWYRSRSDFWTLMNDVEHLFQFISTALQRKFQEPNNKFQTNSKSQNSIPKTYCLKLTAFKRIHMRDLWREHVGVNLDEYLNVEAIRRLCISDFRFFDKLRTSFQISDSESYEDCFYRIFLNHIEPKIKEPTIVHHYPAPMAALSKLSETDPGYAERVEVYAGGLEIANGFTELIDADEQLDRLKKEKIIRGNIGKEVFEIDMEFIEAVRRMPPSAGIALGVDRLAQVLLGVSEINDILALPTAELWRD